MAFCTKVEYHGAFISGWIISHNMNRNEIAPLNKCSIRKNHRLKFRPLRISNCFFALMALISFTLIFYNISLIYEFINNAKRIFIKSI